MSERRATQDSVSALVEEAPTAREIEADPDGCERACCAPADPDHVPSGYWERLGRAFDRLPKFEDDDDEPEYESFI